MHSFWHNKIIRFLKQKTKNCLSKKIKNIWNLFNYIAFFTFTYAIYFSKARTTSYRWPLLMKKNWGKCSLRTSLFFFNLKQRCILAIWNKWIIILYIYEKHMHTYVLFSLHSRSPLDIPIVTVTNIDKHVRTLNL